LIEFAHRAALKLVGEESPGAFMNSPLAAEVTVGLRRYLYLTAAITGAAIMIIEILGAKMLSPYFGTSHFVWTAQIAVTLVALACGYFAGGRLADYSQKISQLYWVILGAAGYLAFSICICGPVAYWCLDLDLAIGSLVASAILFFAPLALLAMTGPFLVRVVTPSVRDVGTSVGRLTAVGTIGSFVGTILIGYVMIPFLPNSITMFLAALILMLFCVAYFVFFRRPAVGAILTIAVFFVGAGYGVRSSLQSDYHYLRELFHGNSHFGQLQVLDRRDGSERYYLNDFLIQNTYDPLRRQSLSHFTYMLSGLARIYTTNINDVLCIGLGAGIVPMDFVGQRAQVDVVEINPAVVPVAEKYFNLERDRVNLRIDDGRHFLNRTRKKYDVVVIDAFLGDASPSHLFTREAFKSVRRVLRPGGVLVINAFGGVENGRDFLAASVQKTLMTVFRSVLIHGASYGEIFYVAGDRVPLTRTHPPNLLGIPPAVFEAAKNTYDGILIPASDHGQVLTDDFNPVEVYDARNREEFRRSLARGARGM
jgi:spermidine synthase